MAVRSGLPNRLDLAGALEGQHLEWSLDFHWGEDVPVEAFAPTIPEGYRGPTGGGYWRGRQVMTRFSALLPAVVILVGLPLLQDSPEVHPEQTDPAALAELNTAFGFDLYHQLCEGEGNLFFSPHSLSVCLAAAWAGARGRTEQEMATVLHLPLAGPSVHEAFRGLQACLDDIQTRGDIVLQVANSVWYQQGQRFLDTYFNLVRSCYGADPTAVDFADNAEAARRIINSWAELHTDRAITELIRPGLLGPMTTLVLCNAIHFKGAWASPFDPSFTAEADFSLRNGRFVRVPMMMQNSSLRWRAFDGFRAAELPYVGEDLSMIIVLPDQVEGLYLLEPSFTAQNVQGWLEDLEATEPYEGELLLPKFSTTCELELAGVLSAMGMPTAFHGADFSGITGTRGLFISEVVHQSSLDVSEEGTEAAAAAAAIFRKGPPAFRVDRPFFFLIREHSTGSILFMGRITDPTR